MTTCSQIENPGNAIPPIGARTRARTVVFALLAMACAIRLLTLSQTPLGRSWSDALIVGLSVAAAIVHLWDRLPAQTWLIAMGIIGALGGTLEFAGGTPLGVVAGGPLWAAGLVISRGTAARVLQPWRRSRVYGFWLIGLGGLLGAAIVSAAESALGQPDTVWRLGIRIASAWGMLVAAAPFFIVKRPIVVPPEWESSGCWVVLCLLLARAAGLQGAWTIAGAITAMGIVIGSVLFRGRTINHPTASHTRQRKPRSND